ncbi:class I glutamine amidotransferase-like protein [Epithele typhae]|uniref:class I glutamine amidotransferase-like protein n=1 Tax=Epithele typhae TaxID=378194 RepID=UPI002007BA5B|nr:class I glutamine amidotransferase-like protein [Epithele typhae]KAH9915443.1 class I glutamine amidotransferase-like protein [Epithele typhae]
MAKRVLFVFSSAAETFTGHPAGWYLPEAAHPYYVLSPKYEIDFASPKGPNPPVNPQSIELFSADKTFLEDPAVQAKLAGCKTLASVDAADYAAVFYVGGHGPVIDLATDPANAALASAFFRAGKPTSAVCHGPGALVGATDAAGASVFKGRRVTGLSNREEEALDAVKHVPFLLEDRMKELGGVYECAELFGVCVVVDGNLITGQNPASGKGVGEALDKLLSASA